MVIKVIGKERQTGVFKDNAYDNTIVYCMEELNSRNPHEGFKTHSLKVRGRVKPYDDLFVGGYFEVFFDEFKNVVIVNKIERKE